MRRGALWRATLLGLLVTAGCDSTFEPLEESLWVYSIAGHLDPAADTQWVRVNELRPTVLTDPDPIDAMVTLEEVETGRTVVMNPVLATYRPFLDGGDEQFAYNFWSAEPIRPGYSYRLTATRSDGATSSAVARIPTEDFTVTYAQWVATSDPFKDLVLVEGVPDLAMVFIGRSVNPVCNFGSPIFLEYQKLLVDPSAPDEAHVVGLDWVSRPAFLPPAPLCPLGPDQIVVVASGDPWPYTASSALRDLMHPNMVGNVENGTGYLAGFVMKSYPREGCTLKEGFEEFCTIRYGPDSAELQLRVTDLCTGVSISSADIVLEEVTGNRVRRFGSGQDGRLRIRGLDPDVEYLLTVTHFIYGQRQTTLTFAPAEVRTIDPFTIDFGGQTPC